MTNLQKFTLFPENTFYSNRYLKFLQTPLGELYQSIPFEELAKLLPKKTSNAGAPNRLPIEGFFGLMFLKAYTKLSDEKLIQRINTDWALQFFCGIQLREDEEIKDIGMPSRIRMYLGEHLEIESVQQTLLAHWSDKLENTHVFLNDATAYESYIKFPTDVKLLWDCVYWIYQLIFALCKELKKKRPRSRFKEQELKQLSFQKTRRKTNKMIRKRKKSLLYLLNKGIGQLVEVLEAADCEGLELDEKQAIRFIYIKEIYRQQKYMYDNHVNTIANRIVSLFKPYIRPIVRGKENKRVEFGAKAVVSQVDGINFIDKLSFDAFNEAKTLKDSILLHKKRFGKCWQIGIDAIYGTNENRKAMKQQDIYHSLVRKGRPSQNEAQEKLLRSELGKERATVLEGSFGNEKNHYGLNKVKARTEATEIIWILFGVMCANAVRISKKNKPKPPPEYEPQQQLTVLN